MESNNHNNNNTNNSNNTNNNNTVMSSSTGGAVHCKVFFNGQFRRFQVTPAAATDGDSDAASYSFKNFRGHVEALLSLSSNFLLKYQDNESDFITISTDEELSYAISILKPGEIFRLFATQEDPTSPSNATSPLPMFPPGFMPPQCGNPYAFPAHHGGHFPHPPPPGVPFPFPHPPPDTLGGRGGHGRHREHPYAGCGRRGGGGGRGGFHHHHHHGGPHGGFGGRSGHCSDAEFGGNAEWGAFKKEKIGHKIAMLESLLAEYSDDDDHGKEKLEKRIAKLRNKLEKFDNRKSRKGDSMDAEGTANSGKSPLWSSIKNKKVAIKQAEAEGNAELVEKLTTELKALRLEKREQKEKKYKK